MPVSSPFNPGSAQAQAIANLFVLTLVIAAGIFVLVTGLVLYASWRYRERPGQEGEPPQIFGHRTLEIGWTVAPALLLAGLFVFTVNTMQASDPSAQQALQAGRQPDLIVTGHQWWWEVKYPATGLVTANEIHIPAGKQLLVQVDSADVIHDFWVPQLARKMDATPGHATHMWLQADEPGTYLGTCSEYCGTQHAWMRIRVIAQPQAEFDAWMQQQLQVPAIPTTGDAADGAKFFQSSTCANCHTIAGTDADGRVGPDLTHIAGRETLGAGVLENTPDTLATWLKDPQAVKPGVKMPDFKLSDGDVQQLVAYLETLK